MFALENSLRLTIGTGYMSANAAFLRSVTSVNIFHFNASCVRFVSEKLFKLKEIPFMQIFSLFFTKSCVLSNASQIFKCNYGSTFKRFYNSLCNHVVSVGSETVLLLGNLLKVSFRRFTSTGLQGTSQLLITLRNFFNMSATIKLIFRGNSNLFYTPIYTNNFASGFRISNIFTENYVQENFIMSDKQFSRTSFPCKILSEIFRNGYRDFNSPIDGKQRKFVAIKPDIVASGVISNRRLFSLWTSCFLLFLNSCFNCLNSFSGFHTSRDGKLRRKVFSGGGIGFIVQRYAIRIAIIPTYLAYIIECLCVCLNGWLDGLYRNIKLNFYGAYQFHVHIISALNVNVNKKMLKRPV